MSRRQRRKLEVGAALLAVVIGVGVVLVSTNMLLADGGLGQLCDTLSEATPINVVGLGDPIPTDPSDWEPKDPFGFNTTMVTCQELGCDDVCLNQLVWLGPITNNQATTDRIETRQCVCQGHGPEGGSCSLVVKIRTDATGNPISFSSYGCDTSGESCDEGQSCSVSAYAQVWNDDQLESATIKCVCQ